MDIRSIGLTIAALVGFSVTIGTSSSAAGSVAGDQCAAAATTVALVACAEGEYRRADQEVNRLYKAILGKLDARATQAQATRWCPGRPQSSVRVLATVMGCVPHQRLQRDGQPVRRGHDGSPC
jgi:uncharacterized protein YecT (DUF1311 family)